MPEELLELEYENGNLAIVAFGANAVPAHLADNLSGWRVLLDDFLRIFIFG